MRTRQANRYARWAAIFASLLATVVLAIYVRRSMQTHEARKQAPPPVPTTVERTSQGFTYSQTTGTGILFTLRASNMTAYKEGDRSLATDVSITVYGKKGDRNDNIHTHSCDFLTASGTVVCAGEVIMDLESAEDAKRVSAAPKGSPVAPKIVHITTSGVTFTKASGETVTDQPVQFQFPGGEGRAIGAHYDSNDGVLNLLRDVHMKLTPPAPKGAVINSAPLPVEVDGTSLEFQRHAQVMYLRGPVTARQQNGPAPSQGASSQTASTQNTGEERELHASLLTVNFDRQLHATKVIATGDANNRPQMLGRGAKGNGTITADEFSADLAPAGWMEHLSAVGNVVGDYKTVADMTHITASRIDADMLPKENQPKTVTATGAVRANSTRANSGGPNSVGGSSTRTIETAALALDFIPGPPARAGGRPRSQLSHAHSLAPATVTMTAPITAASAAPGRPTTQQSQQAQQSSQLHTDHVTAQRMEADFGEHNRMLRMQGHGGTQLDRDLPGHARQTSTSQEFAADFDAQGQWTNFDQSGTVRLRQADRSGQASRAHFNRATDVVTLSGPAEATDATSHTTADSMTFDQRTGEIRAEGNVLSTYTSSAAGSAQGSAQGSPQGNSRVSASTAGNSGGTSGGGSPVASSSGMGPSLTLGSGPTHIKSDHLAGNSTAGRAVYTGHARMWQGDSIMEADEIELNRPTRQLDARGNVKAVFQSAPSNPANGAPGAPSARPASNSSPVSQSSSSSAADAKPALWNVRTAKLTYYDAESRAHLDDNFTAESQGSSIAGQNCDIYFVPPAQRAPGASGGIDHAIARGHVVVHQDERHGQAERADYSAAAGKFVLSGGKPILFDGDGNSVAGRQLTFFKADDTILVESEEGVRTLTRHRVQK
ncbi:MAG: LptA/OstA family protein [Candidatus Acidiferrales bacterium]